MVSIISVIVSCVVLVARVGATFNTFCALNSGRCVTNWTDLSSSRSALFCLVMRWEKMLLPMCCPFLETLYVPIKVLQEGGTTIYGPVLRSSSSDKIKVKSQAKNLQLVKGQARF